MDELLINKKIINRKTIVLPRELEEELRRIQAEQVEKSFGRMSFTSVVTMLIQEAIDERMRLKITS